MEGDQVNLYRKHRPRKFKDVYGNRATVSSLASKLASPDRPHAFLFSGPSGTGKTTLARIAARKLGCSGADLIEVDSADYRGIDSVRDIRQQMRLSPLSGEVRVWILDECHQLTGDAQSALLKALEDTPAHVYFMLATTHPQKLLPTIRNRCTPFNLSPLDEDDLLALLEGVLLKEAKKVPDAVLAQIVQDSLGSARAALVMLEKVIDLAPGEMAEAAKTAALEEQETIALCRILVAKQKRWVDVTKILKGMTDRDPEQVRLAVLGYCKTVLLGGENEQAFLVMDSFKEPFFNTGQAGLVRACYEAVLK